MGDVKEIDAQTREITWNDLSPLGMFKLGWILATYYDEADMRINCDATIRLREGNVTVELHCRKGQDTLPPAVTVIAKLKQAKQPEKGGV